MPNQNTNAPHHIIVTLSDDAFDLLKKLADSQGIEFDVAIRRAITTEGYFHDHRKNGYTILTLKDKKVEEVHFRTPIS